jgi:hypothetical protein
VGGYQERRSQLTQGDGSPWLDVVLPTSANRSPTAHRRHKVTTERQDRLAHRTPLARPRWWWWHRFAAAAAASAVSSFDMIRCCHCENVSGRWVGWRVFLLIIFIFSGGSVFVFFLFVYLLVKRQNEESKSKVTGDGIVDSLHHCCCDWQNRKPIHEIEHQTNKLEENVLDSFNRFRSLSQSLFFSFFFYFFQLAPVGVVDPLGLKEKRRPCNFLEEKEGINSKENHELQYI